MIKQAYELNAPSTLAREAEFYRLAFSTDCLRPLRPFLPRCHSYDADHGILIIQLLPGSPEDLERYYARGHFSLTLARVLGRALGELHVAAADVGSLLVPLPTDSIPWPFSLDRPSLAATHSLSRAGLAAVTIIQQHEVFTRQFRELMDEWRCWGIVHGDMKWSNCIVYSGPGSQRKTRLSLVDWEFAGPGDPCWDTAGIFASFLSFWAMSMPMVPERTPREWEAASKFPLKRLHAAIVAFWDEYVTVAQLNAREAQEELSRSVRFTAVRLLQTAVEQTQPLGSLTAGTATLLQLSLNILQRPREAAACLLGVGSG